MGVLPGRSTKSCEWAPVGRTMFRRIRIRAGSANFYTHNTPSVFPKDTRHTLPFQSVAVLLVVSPTVLRAGGRQVTLLILPRLRVVRPRAEKEAPGRFTVFTSKRLLSRCEPDLPDLTKLHMLLGLPEIVVGLHGKPTLRRTAKRLGKA